MFIRIVRQVGYLPELTWYTYNLLLAHNRKSGPSQTANSLSETVSLSI
jgi:hypothetical protein